MATIIELTIADGKYTHSSAVQNVWPSKQDIEREKFGNFLQDEARNILFVTCDMHELVE